MHATVESLRFDVIHGGLTPLIQFLDTHINKSFKGNVRNRWENWIANGMAEFTKSGKRRKASYEMVAKWIHEEWKGVEHESIKGFRENGYIDYAGNENVLHSRLQQTLAESQVPRELTQEVNDFIAEFSAIDNDDQETAIETDSEPDDDQDNPSSSSDESASSSDESSSSR